MTGTRIRLESAPRFFQRSLRVGLLESRFRSLSVSVMSVFTQPSNFLRKEGCGAFVGTWVLHPGVDGIAERDGMMSEPRWVVSYANPNPAGSISDL